MPSDSKPPLHTRSVARLNETPPDWHADDYYRRHRDELRAKLGDEGALEPLETAWLFEEADYLLEQLAATRALLAEWIARTDVVLQTFGVDRSPPGAAGQNSTFNVEVGTHDG